MPELLRIQTPDFELSIWCSDISKRQAAYQATVEKRQAHHAPNDLTHYQIPVIRFSPPLSIIDATFMGQRIDIDDAINQSTLLNQIEINEPIFFENIQYQFEWVFFDKKGFDEQAKTENAYLTHRSHLVNESFRFVEAHRSIPARLTGSINTSNHVGWMRLPLEYVTNGQTHQSHIAFEVLPTKMSLHDDLPAMYRSIDSVFPLWRFSLVEKTEQDAANSQQRNYFPLLWLANFSHLRSQLEQGLKVINQAPHSRLQAHTSYNKASRLKGKLPARLGAKIKEDFANGLYEKRYQVTKKQLSVDTPENRFVKMVVSTSKKRLADFEHKLRRNNAAPDKQRLSNTFLDELHHWQQPLQKTLKQGFMTDVGAYNGRNHESLVLQQKVGYSSVYRIWQELKFYLDVFDNQSNISMKSVAEIYEVWCFLTLRNILLDELGFEEITTEKQSLKLNDFFEYQLKDGFAGAFEFKRSDGVTARLAHEPIFTKAGADIRSYLISQKPDIVLEITLPKPSNKRFIWLFDAKYRIKTIKNRYDDTDINIDTTDYVPDDAINQMHRYRDALIRLTKDKESKDTTEFQKSRPVFGAFALYPGYFNQAVTTNPYLNEINEVGIGAFALLPSPFKTDSNSNNGHYWLLSFLRQQLGNNLATNPTDNSGKNSSEIKNSSAVNSTAVAYRVNDYDSHADKLIQHTHNLEESLYLQDAARIPYSGMEQVLYPDLIMTIALGGGKGRYSAYFDNFKNGLATWYHLPQSTFLGKYKQHIVNEIRYLALAITSEQNTNSKQITMLWPIKNVITLARNKITITQAGSLSNSAEDYYLFELGKPLTLKDAIIRVPHRPFRNSMKLTTLNHLEQAAKFSELKQVYDQALV
ncbi:DUF2357 domain-containing protein [Psychrobacter sp. ASPA161_9]|uniref:DUF2357 domain-containing protein n=1 Tax=Psychrobacter sp. ASPA161_9 TaxID=3160961 RepID=UPI003F7FABBC